MKNIKRLREERELSQQQLADKLSTSQQNIYKYERDITEPDISTLIRLADFFETSIDYIIGYTSIPHKIEPVEKFELNHDEAELMEKYRKLNGNARQNLQNIIDTILSGNK